MRRSSGGLEVGNASPPGARPHLSCASLDDTLIYSLKGYPLYSYKGTFVYRKDAGTSTHSTISLPPIFLALQVQSFHLHLSERGVCVFLVMFSSSLLRHPIGISL